ncbi:MAG: DUF2057 domain-containing protein [Pseudomonadota bacterium]|jgi:uncharacterized protein|uniref:DUF2057 domain-containing protein n=1 Tax=Alcanivorax sp. TaxID=1872427 RepID=UPI00243DDC26|nr:DUF2057 domain-containing protein [Alcanivorax sp.]MEE3319937.1 DUF2057 domain-containing protein [Pseudomonadota bacterium]
MLSLRLTAVTLFTLLLCACAQSPVVQLYDGPAQSDNKVVTVRVPSELEVFTINGEEVEGVNTFFATDFKDLKLTPGRYEILAYYKELWQLDADNHEIVKTNPANFIVDGKPGEMWVLGYEKPADVDAARAMEDSFNGWAENTVTGEKVAAEKSELILKRGFLAPVTGEELSAPASNTVAPQAATAVAPAAAEAAAPAAAANYLDTLKAQWNQATPEERREFLQWIAE